jgi:hypothetical protein
MSKVEKFMPDSVGEMEDRLRQMYAGLTSQTGSFINLVLNGKSLTNADIAVTVLAWLNLFVAVDQTHSSYEQALATRNAAQAAILAFMEAFVKGVESQVGNTDQALEPYGFRTKKEAAPQTVPEKAAKVQKGLATREKNHTMGEDQKKALDQGGNTSQTPPVSGQKS